MLVPYGLPLSSYYLTGDKPRMTIGLRPEAIEIRPGGQYEGRVLSCEYFGDSYVVKFHFGGQDLVLSSAKKAYDPGEIVRFSFDPQELLFFSADTGQRI